MTFEYITTCQGCREEKSDLKIRSVGMGATLVLCDDCAEIHEGFAERAGKGAKIQQAEDKLIGVIKSE